ncbi:TRAP transporter large permease [Aliihoeflea sp. PC F10.4]
MTSLEVGFAAIGILLLLMAMRVPVAIALGIVSICGIYIVRGSRPAFHAMGSAPFDFAASWHLSAIPMFLFMGALAHRGGLTRSLFAAARAWVGWVPGGLAVSANLAAAMFSAASGSSVATAAAMSRLSVPEMIRYRYDPAFASATVAAAGTLGAMIPPSIAFVIYGWYTQTAIGSLLIAGVLPGLMTAGLYSVLIIGRAMKNPALAPRPSDEELAEQARQRWRLLGEVWPLPALVILVIGGIYTGVTTPTESGAFGAFCAALISLSRGNLTWSVIRESVVDTLTSATSVFVIAIMAQLFTRFLSLCGIPDFLSGLVEAGDVSPYAIILFVIITYLILGMFLDPIGILLLTLPIFLPMFQAADLNLIWMGVLVVKLLEVGMITPPLGLNAYVVKAAVGNIVSLGAMFRSLTWFIALEFVIIALLVVFPQISLLLPELMR